MFRIKTTQPVTDTDIRRLSAYFDDVPPLAPLASNHNKHQYIFADVIGGREVILKLFVHKKKSHRLASFLGVASADSYFHKARLLKAAGLPVPGSLALLKAGRGLAPERTIYVMEKAPGEMLYPLLQVIEADAARTLAVAAGIAELVRRLRLAGVTHRDLNVKNVLVTPDNSLTLIDLDSARAHGWRGRAFRRRHERDIQTFLSTCHGAPKFAAAVASQIAANHDQ